MKTRILAGVIGGLLFLFLIFQGGIWLSLAVACLSILATREICQLLQKTGIEVSFPLVLLFNLIMTIGQSFVLLAGSHRLPAVDFGGLYFLALLFIVFLINMGKGVTQTTLVSIFAHLFALFYPGFLFLYIISIRNLPLAYGWQCLIFAFAVIWGTDSGAYFIGSALGKTPLASKLSPNKTVEGALGGLVVGTLSGVLFGLFFQFPLFWSIGTGLLTSIAGQTGDLFESLLKRTAGLKDSGVFMPGHGGVLDRFDSAFFALPVVYYLALLLI